MADITDHEVAEIDHANGSGRTPVVFVHGLWLPTGTLRRARSREWPSNRRLTYTAFTVGPNPRAGQAPVGSPT